MKRTCGGCTLCCKLVGVAELEKPAGEWCSFCAVGKGCRVQLQPERPKTCGEFECLWLQGIGGEGLRPDRSKVVMATTKDGKSLQLYVDPSRPDAYKVPSFNDAISRIVDEGGQVFVVIGDKRKLIRSGSTGLHSQAGQTVLANRTNGRRA